MREIDGGAKSLKLGQCLEFRAIVGGHRLEYLTETLFGVLDIEKSFANLFSSAAAAQKSCHQSKDPALILVIVSFLISKRNPIYSLL